jgi:2-desacetyl-2-hydroxyethyl bacteriochlorophyllide A dehydrogenase
MKRRSLFFTGPRQLELREEAMPEPRGGELLVKTELSAISAGTEMLAYRGEIPSAIDAQGDAISGQLSYPLAYGYAAVGRVLQTGPSADPNWRDRLVFSFQPHCSHFSVTPEHVIPVPEGLSPENAVFLPNMETAVNLAQDSAPLLGERVLVLGQGVVGLLAAALLHEFPVECLVTADQYARRRTASASLGVTSALDPGAADFQDQALQFTGASRGGYDLTLELTGNPSALNQAIALTTFSGRVVVGSWYGTKTAPVEFGGRYHRSRITITASQVSTIAPQLAGRWDKGRRFGVAWEQVRRIRPARWITQRFSIATSAEAYRMLDEAPQDTIQLIFNYP